MLCYTVFKAVSEEGVKRSGPPLEISSILYKLYIITVSYHNILKYYYKYCLMIEYLLLIDNNRYRFQSATITNNCNTKLIVEFINIIMTYKTLQDCDKHVE